MVRFNIRVSFRAVAGPTVWNLLPDELRGDRKHFPAVTESVVFQTVLVCSAHWRFFYDSALYKLAFYFLT